MSLEDLSESQLSETEEIIDEGNRDIEGPEVSEISGQDRNDELEKEFQRPGSEKQCNQ